MRATVQIHSLSASNLSCCRVQGWVVFSLCSARTMAVDKPQAKVIITQQRRHKDSNTFCCSTGDEMWGMNDQNKIMFGQHPAQNKNVSSGIHKVRDVDLEQQNHWDNGFGYTEHPSKLQLLWLSARGTCRWSVDFGGRATLAFIAGAWQKKINSVTLLSQAQVQHLHKYLMAVTHKAVLQLRKKLYRHSPAGVWTQMTLTRQEARKRGKVLGEESTAAAQGMWIQRIPGKGRS